ncbi:hypothetical protein IAD21_01555 [Abditibacteriota bacterium]|nr:hypothetical protein IAD21_01555 [Abditibacteriota bacterium]
MKHSKLAVFALNLALAPALMAAPTKPSTGVQTSGDVATPRLWTLAALQKIAPVQTIKTTLKGKPYTVRGVPLWALVSAATPKLDPKSKHSESRFVVLARGKDGYLSSFAYPDLMPDTGNQGVFVVWEANGKPLSAKEGPFRLVVPDDKKPMRWVYNLTAIEIYDGKRLTGNNRMPR